MKSSFIWKIFGFVLMVHQSECQNMAGLIATLTGGLNNGFPNTGSAGGTSNCPFLPHRDKHKFIQNGSEMTCAPGTVYDRSACRCVDANAPKGPPQPGSNPRVEALANAMKGMRSAPPGMQQMMTELFRQFQSTTGVSNAPPPPIIPRNNQAPPAFPKQFTPSRSVPPLNQRRQMITKPPTPGVRPTGSGRKFGGPGRGSGTNSVLGRGGPGSGFGGSMTNPFAGMGGPGGMGSMGALGGLGGGSPDLTNLLGALGGGSGLAGLGPLGALSGSTRPGAAPPDLTNMFNSQGRMIPATMTALTSINLPLLNIMDRQGYVDVSDLTPQGKIAASRFFSQSGSMARLASLGPLGQLG